MVSVDFSFETKYGTFSDAIWFKDNEPLTADEIEAEKQRRLANWVSMIESPAPVAEG